jgi:hypothetical protein
MEEVTSSSNNKKIRTVSHPDLFYPELRVPDAYHLSSETILLDTLDQTTLTGCLPLINHLTR